jgi:hypothetical protein
MLCILYHRSLISDIRWHVPLCRQGLVHLGIVCVWYHVLYHICVYDYISHIYIYILYITHDIIRHRASALLVWPVPPSGCVLASGPPASSRPSLQLWDCFKGTPPIPTFKCSNSYIYSECIYTYLGSWYFKQLRNFKIIKAENILRCMYDFDNLKLWKYLTIDIWIWKHLKLY